MVFCGKFAPSGLWIHCMMRDSTHLLCCLFRAVRDDPCPCAFTGCTRKPGNCAAGPRWRTRGRDADCRAVFDGVLDAG